MTVTAFEVFLPNRW